MSTNVPSISEKFRQTFLSKLNSGSALIWIYITGDEGRAERALHHIIHSMKDSEGNSYSKFFTWDAIGGVSWKPVLPVVGPVVPGSSADQLAKEAAALCDPMVALAAIANKNGIASPPGSYAVVMRDLHKFLNDDRHFGMRRLIAELCKQTTLSSGDSSRQIILLADTPVPHADIRDYCDVISFALPNYGEMQTDVVEYIQDSMRETAELAHESTSVADMSDDLKDRITYSLLGTSSEEAYRILSYASQSCGGFNEKCLDVIAVEKAVVIQKVEGLKYIPKEDIPDASSIGGFSEFLPWLRRRGRLYTKHARATNQELPRGCVIIGPPGSGKTHVAMSAAKILGLDLIMFDVGSMFNKFVGGTEQLIRKAISTIDALPSCLLCVDEIDKTFAGAADGHSGDSGVSSRMLSYFLNWLSSRNVSSSSEHRCFVMVTMNRTAGVPPELLRPGRFDCVWSTDLPSADEREEILSIHLRKRGISPDGYGKSLRTLTHGSGAVTVDYSGAELEEVVRSAKCNAYDARMTAWEEAGAKDKLPTIEDCIPTVEELSVACKEIVPLARLAEADIKEIRAYCSTKAKPVNGKRISDESGLAKADVSKRGARHVAVNRKQDSANN